jgi:hypothetical protein
MVGSTLVKGAIRHLIAFILLLPYASYADTSKEIDQRTGVQIIYTPEPDMFPKEWLTDPVNARVFPLPEMERERSSSIIKSALRKYPASILKARLERVYVVRNLIISGVPLGGTSSGNRVYIVNRGIPRGYTDAVIEEIFHHEVAHILLRHFITKFNAAEWGKINPPGFQYSGSGLEAIKKKKHPERSTSPYLGDSFGGGRQCGWGSSSLGQYDRAYLKDGFLYEYATSHWQEDFCLFAQNLFMGKEVFWEIAARYEKIERKTAMVIGFYRAIDPTFTEDYFRRLVKATPGGRGGATYYDT